jgi:hypothetical protein
VIRLLRITRLSRSSTISTWSVPMQLRISRCLGGYTALPWPLSGGI